MKTRYIFKKETGRAKDGYADDNVVKQKNIIGRVTAKQEPRRQIMNASP